jgi:hypothetical protein
VDSASSNVPTQDVGELFAPCARAEHGLCPRDVFIQHPRATAGLPLLFGMKPGRRDLCKCPCHKAVSDSLQEKTVSVVTEAAPPAPAAPEVDPLAFEEPAPSPPPVAPKPKKAPKKRAPAPETPGLFG